MVSKAMLYSTRDEAYKAVCDNQTELGVFPGREDGITFCCMLAGENFDREAPAALRALPGFVGAGISGPPALLQFRVYRTQSEVMQALAAA